jgi:chlorophyll synthase
MTLNDFKSIEGDRQMGLASLPARLGPDRACRLACFTMAAAQAAIVLLLLHWGMPVHACIVVALLTAQLVLMLRLLDDPRGRAPWYNATGTTLYVLGMLATAFALAP